jgi:hypothetical protein
MRWLKHDKFTPLRTHRGWAAVFFGETGLELTTVRGTGSAASVDIQQTAPYPPSSEGTEPAFRWEAAVGALRKQINPQEYRLVTAIGSEDVLCQTLRLPTTQSAELQQMLDLQIDGLTPFPLEEVVYSFEPIETTENETRLLVAVARKAAVNERVATLEAAGLQPEVVSVDAVSVFGDLIRRGTLPTDDKLNALVLVSTGAVNIIIYTLGKLTTVRSLVVDAAALDKPDTLLAVREDLQRTIVATEVEQPLRELGKVTFATWIEALRPQVAELTRAWGTNAETLANGSAPTPAASLGFECAQADGPRLNLLPEEWRERRRAAGFRKFLVRGTIVLLAIYVLALLVFLAMMGVKRAQLSKVDAEIAQRQGPFKTARDLHMTLVAMQKQLDTKYSSLEVLRAVSMLMPDNVKLNGFTYKKNESVTLRAQAQSAGMATDFISRLEKCELFSKVSTGQMRTEPGSGLTKFDVVCTLNSAATVPALGSYGAK